MTLPIKGASLGNPDDAVRVAVKRGAQNAAALQRYAVALWVRCAELGIRADAAFAQADEETGTFTSTRWTREGNPAGLGITTGMPDSTVQRTLTPEEWADCHAVHLGAYAGIDPGPELRALDFRWGEMVKRGWFGVAETMQDLDERWAEDGPQQYGDVIESRWRNYNFPAMERWTPPVGGSEGRPDVAGFQKVQFVGAKGPVYLPGDIEVIIDIVPSRITNVRSNQRSTAQTITTWHDTGNPNSDARGERNYLHSGAEGRAVGYNFAFDAKRIYQLTPLDEVTWHAGTAEGNRVSWGAEQCLNTDWAGALRVGAALHGGLCAMMGWAVDTHLVKHQYWYGKWCPAQILNRGVWSQVVKMTSDAALAAAAAAMGGKLPDQPTPGVPVYATPVPIPELAAFAGKPEDTIPYRVDGDGWVALAVFDRVRAIKDTPRLRYSGGDELVGGPVKKGEEFDVSWLLISADFPDTYLTPWNTRIRAADTQRISDVTQSAA